MAAVGLESSSNLTHHPIGVGGGATVDVVDHRLPLLKIRLHQPVDERLHLGFHILRCVGDDLGFEPSSERLLVEKARQATQPHGLVKEGETPLLHPEEHILDVGQPETELAIDIVDPCRGLTLDVGDGCEVVLQKGQPAVNGIETDTEQSSGDPDGVAELESKPFGVVESGLEPGLNCGQATGCQRVVVIGELGPAGLEGRDRKDLGGRAEQPHPVGTHPVEHLGDIAGRLQDVDLVDRHHDFLAPLADAFEEDALGFRERAIGRGDEEDEVGPRDIVGGQRLVAPVKRVGSGGVDEAQLAQEIHRSGHPLGYGVDVLATVGLTPRQ